MQIKTSDHLILFTDTDDQRILQSDWLKGMTGHIQAKKLVSHNTFP